MLLLDLDGVVYRGAAAVPYAVAALRTARARGTRLGFVTNNASRTPGEIAAQLTGLGIPASAEEVVTSAQAAAGLLAARLSPGSAVLVVGSAALAAEVAAAGLQPVRRCAEARRSMVAAVVQGFAPDLTYDDLTEAALAVADGAWWVTANLDPTLPTERGLQPGNGALVAAVATATGRRPDVAGKPGLALHVEAVRRTGATRPLVIGDRLDTDIAGARAAGVHSLLVLTGVTSLGDLLNAASELRPTHLAADLRGLHLAHPAATGQDGVGRCGSAEARGDPSTGLIRVTADGERDDRIRATVLAAWSWPAPAGGWRLAQGPATLPAEL